jgi:OPA family glycerol-3-phosphate transporter-like MFS transporter
MEPAAGAGRLGRWQLLTVALLFCGYAAYYFCRSDFSVAMPLLVTELQRKGLSADAALVRLGSISSFGVLAYAAGKLFLAGSADIWGGKRSFLGGLAGAVAFTLLFAVSGTLPLFTLAWIGNRLTQSIGWAGLVKVCSKWFSYSSYGTVLGVLSLSFLIGDAAGRELMAGMIQANYGWRSLFLLAALAAGALFVCNLLFLREDRLALGFTQPQVNPFNVYQERAPRTNITLKALLAPLLSNRAFWLVCLLSLGCTLIRETFNLWTPTYFRSLPGYTAASAASMSALFPAIGALSVLLTGWLSDRFGALGRPLIMMFGLGVSAAGLSMLMSVTGESAGFWPVFLVSLVAFGLLGPYSYLAGAMALDFGGSEGGALSSGIIDAVGYFGGVLAGGFVARVAVSFGWRGVFLLLAAVSLLSALAAGYLFFHQRGRHRNAAPTL